MNELLWCGMLLVNFGGILLVYRRFGPVGLYAWMAMACIVANIQVVKVVEIFGLTATLGNIVYASSFLATDILSENHGKKAAGRAVHIGFFSLVMMTILMNMALWFEPAAADFSQKALETIFGFMPRIVLASLSAYLLSQWHDVAAFHFWKRIRPGRRYLWLRNNASTMISQLIDTTVFCTIAFAGVFEPREFWSIFITTYVLKFVVAALDTPFVYLARTIHDRGLITDTRVSPATPM